MASFIFSNLYQLLRSTWHRTRVFPDAVVQLSLMNRMFISSHCLSRTTVTPDTDLQHNKHWRRLLVVKWPFSARWGKNLWWTILQSEWRLWRRCVIKLHILEFICTDSRWDVTKNKYFVSVVFIQDKVLFFLLLTFSKPASYFSFTAFQVFQIWEK